MKDMLLQGKSTIQTFVCTVVFLHKYKQMTLTLVSKMAQFIDFFLLGNIIKKCETLSGWWLAQVKASTSSRL